MSRIRNWVRGIASGYVQLIANIAYTTASIPIALHYLSKEEFGLWALVTQVAGYLALIDLGMQGSVSRILIDHKDDRNGGEYGAVIKTGAIVFSLQGVIVAAAGCLLSPFASRILNLPIEHESVFRILIMAQAVLLGLGFFTRIFGAPLYAHQRYDVLNLAASAQLVIMLVTLWWGFRLGWGLYSMIFSAFAGFLWTAFVQAFVSIRLGMFPSRGHWGNARMNTFKELFSYGKDLFLMALGWQLLSASQVIIVTRTMGLDAAATWAVCTKMFALAQQVVWRVYDFSMGAFSEMYVRGENERLRRRFKDTLTVTASLSVLVGVVGAVCNSDFVLLWTGGRIGWSTPNDVLMALLLISYSVNRCHGGLVSVSKEIGFAKFIYFAEGLCFVALAFPAARMAGFPGIIAAAIGCDIAFAGSFGLYRSKRFFHVGYSEMVFVWLREALRLLVVFALLGIGVWGATRNLPLTSRIVVSGSTACLSGALLFWVFGLNQNIRTELCKLANKPWTSRA